MSVSQLEIKQSVEDSVTGDFNWGTCPPKFSEAFKKVLGSERRMLNLCNQEVNDDDVLSYIVPFLDAYQHITTLNIDHNIIGDVGAGALACNTTLKTLDISYNYIGDMGTVALASNTTLTTLNVRCNNIDDAGAMALAGNTTLTTLDISCNNIGAAGAEALACNTTLITLHIRSNKVGAAGAEALARNTTLTTLNICWNGVGDAGAEALACNTTLKTLNISANYIGAAGVGALACNTTLKTLDISDNGIGTPDARALAGNTTLMTYMSLMGVGDASAGAFAGNTTLMTLNISGNCIGDASARSLANNETLTALEVRYNYNIGLPGAQALMRCQQNRVEKCKNQKLAFLMGTRQNDKSSMQTLIKSGMFEKNLLGAMLDFIEAKPLHLMHTFSPEIMSALSSCENNTPSASLSSSTACNGTVHNEVKETKEEHERTDQALALREVNALHCLTPQTLEHDVEAVTFVFRTALPLSTSYGESVADDNEVKVSSEAHEVEEKARQEYNEMNAYVLVPENADDSLEIQSVIAESIRERDDLNCHVRRAPKRKAEAIAFSSNENTSSSSSAEASTPGVPAVDAAEQRRQTVRNAWAKRFPSSKQ